MSLTFCGQQKGGIAAKDVAAGKGGKVQQVQGATCTGTRDPQMSNCRAIEQYGVSRLPVPISVQSARQSRCTGTNICDKQVLCMSMLKIIVCMPPRHQ
jgi:hypothetical protein